MKINPDINPHQHGLLHARAKHCFHIQGKNITGVIIALVNKELSK